MNLQPIKQRFGILGNAPSLDHALRTAVQVAPTDLTILITGESGVGKESFSKVVHALSARKHNTFIAVNCGAIPEGTINSELFGHTKGAFTGAMGDRKGYFETANGGTIFLDEIGEMPLQTQQFLLRVLENKEFIKVGSSQVETTDVRVVAATNVDLLDKVRQGKFREDLYYRLNTVPIRVPALRERSEDIGTLFRKFAHDFAEKYHTQAVRLDEKALLLLESYPWNGNIRELKNTAEKISALSAEKQLSAESLLMIMPELLNRNLPVLSGARGEFAKTDSNQGYYEREILFKFLYEMKKDLHELKNVVAELAHANDLRMPANFAVAVANNPSSYADFDEHLPSHNRIEYPAQNPQPQLIINNSITNTNDVNKTHPLNGFNDAEEVEETRSLADMEREMIQKSLEKHRGRRKDAARELGISERTLYRKINEYKLENL
jgi:DNA-binding NtrC family response regulator